MFISKVSVCGYRASAEGPLECEIPGRFAVLVGPNSGGKTTVCDAIYLAHRKRFPQLQPPSADALGVRPRSIEVEYAFEDDPADEGGLGRWLRDGNYDPPTLERSLHRELGRVRSRSEDAPNYADQLLVLTLPAHRYPLDELARREARSLIELLRAEQQRRHNHRNLLDLRKAAEHALDGLVQHSLVEAVRDRIGGHLDYLTSGVQHHHAFIGRQAVDDAFLARVLEMLLSAIDERALAQRLELSGLGYVNLLHIAVTLAAIPGDDPLGERADGTETEPAEADQAPGGESDGAAGEPGVASDDDPSDLAPVTDTSVSDLEFEEEEASAAEDSFFPKDRLHATVIIEEPEAHLHPQLHRGLVAYLRRTVEQRPEVQVVLTSHSSEIVSSAGPENLVVLRRESAGERVSRPIARLPLSDQRRKVILRSARVHLDAARGSTLFAERVVLVEGVTDAMLLRQLARSWASGDPRRLDRVEALTVVPVGTKVGEWTVELLATPDYELVQRLAILSDTDHRDPETEPAPPAWLAKYPVDRVRRFTSHPTLEPAITPGNEEFVGTALDAMSISRPADVTAAWIDDKFRGSKRKAEFAHELAAVLADAIAADEQVVVPDDIKRLLEFITALEHDDAGGDDEQEADETDSNGASDPD